MVYRLYIYIYRLIDIIYIYISLTIRLLVDVPTVDFVNQLKLVRAIMWFDEIMVLLVEAIGLVPYICQFPYRRLAKPRRDPGKFLTQERTPATAALPSMFHRQGDRLDQEDAISHPISA